MSKTPMVRLIALGREGSRQVYGTRRLVAGDEFEMPRQTADLLVRTGRAKLASSPMSQQPAEPAPDPQPPPPVPAPEPEPVSHETDEEPEETDEDTEAAVESAPDAVPKRPRGRPPIHGRYSRRMI